MPTEQWCEPSNLVAMAVNYHGPLGFDVRDVAALQLVWADDHGRLPWEPAFPARLRRLQPILDPTAPAP